MPPFPIYLKPIAYPYPHPQIPEVARTHPALHSARPDSSLVVVGSLAEGIENSAEDRLEVGTAFRLEEVEADRPRRWEGRVEGERACRGLLALRDC